MSNKIKWAYQRVRYGYDDTIQWSFQDYLWMILQPLKEFCLEELKNKDLKQLDVKRYEIYTTTLKMVDDAQNMPYENSFKSNNAEDKFWAYFGKHIGYYWN